MSNVDTNDNITFVHHSFSKHLENVTSHNPVKELPINTSDKTRTNDGSKSIDSK